MPLMQRAGFSELFKKQFYEKFRFVSFKELKRLTVKLTLGAASNDLEVFQVFVYSSKSDPNILFVGLGRA